jgi:predicted nucleotidyltransferase
MNNESRQHCTPLRNAVDPSIVRVLRLLEPTARSADCEYFVAGATARDVDFGVAVESWAQFELLKERLIATREFAAAPKV